MNQAHIKPPNLMDEVNPSLCPTRSPESWRLSSLGRLGRYSTRTTECSWKYIPRETGIICFLHLGTFKSISRHFLLISVDLVGATGREPRSVPNQPPTSTGTSPSSRATSGSLPAFWDSKLVPTNHISPSDQWLGERFFRIGQSPSLK